MTRNEPLRLLRQWATERDESLKTTAGFQRESTAPDLFAEGAESQATSSWKDEVNRRLAAHRNRQGSQATADSAELISRPTSNSTRAAQAAARVAARYAKAPAYRDLFAGDAEAVVRAAGAAVEAARDAQAAAEAVLAGLQAHLPVETHSLPQTSTRWQDDDAADAGRPEMAVGAAMPRWHDTIPEAEARNVWEEMRVLPSARYEPDSPEVEDARVGEMVEPVQTSTANLIEFPRELVASRKARPRLAEGPFAQQATSPQLNIFEVDPTQLSASSAPETQTAPPQWTQMEWERASSAQVSAVEEALPEHSSAEVLEPEPVWHRLPEIVAEETTDADAMADVQTAEGTEAVAQSATLADAQHLPELFVAGQADRLLAGIVDFSLVALAYLGAATVALASTDQMPSSRVALEASLVGMLLFGVAYLVLFFAFSDQGTPGMRYARIALCTFDDNNPTVGQCLMRIPAMLLAILPLGAGLLWSIVDRENLGLHDRLSKTYQRKY